MKNKKIAQTFATIIFFIVCMILGGLLGFSMTQEFGDSLSWWKAILRITEGLFLFFVAFFLQVVLHELGHMIAALARGWSFIHFMILGVLLSRRNGKFHLSRFSMPGVGGQCLMMPPEKGDTDFGIAIYNAGGVLMNVVVTVAVAIIFACFYDSISWDVGVLLASLCFTGVFFALVNGIPSAGGGVPNDGKNICELRKDAFATRVFLVTMRIMGKLQQGSHVDEVAKGYLTDSVKIDYTNPIHELALNFDLSLAVAKLDFEKAHSLLDLLEPVFNTMVPIYQKEITYEMVFLYLVSPRKGVDVGLLINSDTLKYFEMQTAFRPTALRVKYAFARLYECNEEKAEEIYKQFQEVCKHYHNPGEVYTERKLVEYVRSMTKFEVGGISVGLPD